MNQIVHFMAFGKTACLKPGVPKNWPEHHKWSGAWTFVTCADCLKGRELIDTFTISPDGKSITCKRCKLTSSNPNDVEKHYCVRCHVFHDDLWPPARQWWIDHPEPMKVTKVQLEMAAAHGCQMPGCDHENHEQTLFLHGRCHPKARVDCSYTRGTGALRVECSECHQLIVLVAVAD